jgi:hypothetical protein
MKQDPHVSEPMKARTHRRPNANGIGCRKQNGQSAHRDELITIIRD